MDWVGDVTLDGVVVDRGNFSGDRRTCNGKIEVVCGKDSCLVPSRTRCVIS